jgi:hypothetical protein
MTFQHFEEELPEGITTDEEIELDAEVESLDPAVGQEPVRENWDDEGDEDDEYDDEFEEEMTEEELEEVE